MASSSAFETTYLSPAAGAARVPVAAGRGQVAGAVYRLRARLADGYSPALAHSTVDDARILEQVDRAARLISTPALKVDYLAIDSA